ncbi:hypothetical protein V1264_003016 [Littorina saxatilis]|uniref:Sulfatase N-terminal domain-containing protein n=1 Tax=Littorina saxatilis TaxID=31220 RepID=A0AAN9B6H6_9CAEN
MKSTLLVSVCVWVSVATKLPNIVFVLTDDQDTELGGLTPIAKTRQLIGKEGITYQNMFVSSPLCCPSRSSIFSGKYVHNHRGLNNSIAGGCSDSSWQAREEPSAFPVLLKAAGYNTMFAGKYLNQYGGPKTGGVAHIPPGWDWWYGLVGNSKYYNYKVSVNGTEETHGHVYAKDYFTNYIHRKAVEFLQYQNKEGNPIFMMLSTPACHGPFTPADNYLTNFTGMVAPRGGNYNVTPHDKHWLIQQTIVPLPDDTVASEDKTFVNRWRTLLSVDDMVENVYNMLKQKDMLDNTYIFFSSDNGFHLGQFGLPSDKRQLYEFDIRVPLMIRGPGIPAGQVSQENVMNIDLGPTFIDLANQQVPDSVDGQSLKATWTLESRQGAAFRDNVLVEHFGEHHDSISGCPQFAGQGMGNCNNHCVCEDSWNNTFSCVRSTRSPNVYKYCIVKETQDFVEVYELTGDRYEFDNMASSADPNLLRSLQDDLDQLTSCSGTACNLVKHST